MNELGNTVVPAKLHPCGPWTPTQLLTRAFAMYRERPRVVLGLVAIVAVVQVVAIGVIATPLTAVRHGMGEASPAQFIFPRIGTALLAGLMIFLVTQVIHGAYFYAVTAWLEEREISISDACSLALGRIGSLVRVALQVALRTLAYMVFGGLCVVLLGGVFIALMPGIFGEAHRGAPPLVPALRALPLVLLAMVALFAFFFWVVARYAISIPACLAESLPGSAAIRRSITLSSKSKGRIYAMYAVLIGISIVNMSITIPLRVLSLHYGTTTPTATLLGAVTSAANLLFGAGVISLAGIAVTLCYYDLRVRKENYGTPETNETAQASSQITPGNATAAESSYEI